MVLVSWGRRDAMPQTEWLERQTFAASQSGVGKSKIEVPIQSGSGERSLSVLSDRGRLLAFLLCVLMWQKEKQLCGVSYQGTNPFTRAPPS